MNTSEVTLLPVLAWVLLGLAAWLAVSVLVALPLGRLMRRTTSRTRRDT